MKRQLAQAANVNPYCAPFFTGTIEQASQLVIEQARAQGGGYAVLCNVHVLMSAQDDRDSRLALDEAWKVFPDGAPIAWLQRRLGNPDARRVSGPDLMPAVLDRGRPLKIRHFLFGSQPHVVDELTGRLRARYPGVEICGTLAPAANSEESELSLDAIRSMTPDIVWVALGAPKQETWMRRHAIALRPALLIGVGAAFDFGAGTRGRAPSWMQRAGLEWLHRLGAEPQRLFRRYLVTNSAFLLLALRLLARGFWARLRPNAGVGRD